MSTPPTARIRELLASRHLLWWVLGLAIALGLPTLDIGVVGDDVPQYAFLREHSSGGGTGPWWNMFSLVEGPRAQTLGMRTSGRYPWWVDPDLRIVFFRPVSVLTHRLDHWLWPNTIWLMHLHSVLWHVLACGLAWALARRLCSDHATAGLVALLYAVSFTHVIPTAWLAHRNGLVSTAFALASLLAHDGWRRDGSKLGAVASPVLLGLSLLAAEAGVAILGFFAAFALLFDEAPLGRRVLSLMPALVVVVSWRVVYDSVGAGSTGSWAYLDPVGDPLGFLRNLPERYPWLLATSVIPPAMLRLPIPVWAAMTTVVSLAVLVFVVRVPSRPARFGILAVALGCIPLAASIPGDRLLVLTSFGMALTVAELASTWLIGPDPRQIQRACAIVVVATQLLLPPVVGVWLASNFHRLDSDQGDVPSHGPGLPNEGLERKGLIIVHAPNVMSAAHLPGIRSARGLAAPNFLWILHEGPEPPELRRIDAQTLELRSTRGWPGTLFSGYWRSPSSNPFAVGDSVRTLDFVATVKAVDHGRATIVEFEFRAPLEHPSFVWATWGGSEFELGDPERW